MSPLVCPLELTAGDIVSGVRGRWTVLDPDAPLGRRWVMLGRVAPTAPLVYYCSCAPDDESGGQPADGPTFFCKHVTAVRELMAAPRPA